MTIMDARLSAQTFSRTPADTPARTEIAALAVILVVATVLRVIGLNGPLWFDEIVTVDTHLHLGWGDMMHHFEMNHHYLHNLQAKLAMALFGDADWVVRLPAMLMGLATVVAVWWLARQIGGRAVGLVVAALMATSYHEIWFSQNARGYTELAFWSSLGTILYLRGLRQPDGATWMGYGVTLMLATFTHLTGAFLFAAQGLVWLGVLARRMADGSLDRKLVLWPAAGYLFGAVLTVAVYLPLLPSLIATVSGVSATSAVDVMAEYQSPFWTVLEGVQTALGHAGIVSILVAVAVFVLTVVGGVAARGTTPQFGVMVLVHVLLTVAILSVLGMRIWPRFFFADIGFLLILIVMGVRAVCALLGSHRDRRSAILFALSAAAMVAISGALAVRNYVAPKQDLAGAVALVSEIRQPGERVYAVGPGAEIFRGHFGRDWRGIGSDGDYDEAMAVPGPVLLVVAFPDRSFRLVPHLQNDRNTRLELVRRLPGTLGDGSIFILRRP